MPNKRALVLWSVNTYFHLTPSLSIDAVMCSIVRKVDALHEEIRQTLGAVAAGVKRRYNHIEDGSYKANRKGKK